MQFHALSAAQCSMPRLSHDVDLTLCCLAAVGLFLTPCVAARLAHTSAVCFAAHWHVSILLSSYHEDALTCEEHLDWQRWLSTRNIVSPTNHPDSFGRAAVHTCDGLWTHGLERVLHRFDQ
eukprot:TRINITY_DN12447_c0_g2_i1.p1 TRINITY_DN12447_c0_g2~~TRINITY_DN12447_c0_g2_i1.p1  ORF type:complete len:121 (-),score=14.50 TRINITY_DN12447_c0_g2_i1:195-557(-)